MIDPLAPRFFLDSSVILAGVASKTGAAHALLSSSELGIIRAAICPFIQDEVKRNLGTKLRKGIPRYEQLKATIDWEIIPNPDEKTIERWAALVPAKDALVLAAAVEAQPKRFITHDVRHFVQSVQVAEKSGLIILTPGEVLQEIRAAIASGFA